MLHIDGWDEETGGWLQRTLRFIAGEARALRPGGETVITRLADILVVQALRTWLDSAPEARRGCLRCATSRSDARWLRFIARQSATSASRSSRSAQCRPGARKWTSSGNCPRCSCRCRRRGHCHRGTCLSRRSRSVRLPASSSTGERLRCRAPCRRLSRCCRGTS
jgi:Cupin